MAPAKPRTISVIVPTRDRPELLRQALSSVRALEGADYAFEILVCDNGLSNLTRNVANEFAALYLPVHRAGAGAARNVGLRAATGEYLAFLDDDDAWLPTHLAKHFEVLDARPEIEAVIGQVVYTDPLLSPIDGTASPAVPPGARDQLLRAMLSGFFPQIGTTLVRARVFSAIGEFDEALLGGQDLDWLLRIARRRSLEFVAVPCILFRQRADGSFDALLKSRINYDRRVFLRHALPERRIWRSASAFLAAYRGTLEHFYSYFERAALHRGHRGDLGGTLKAILSAAAVFPLRATYDVFAPRPLRRALGALLRFHVRRPTLQRLS